MSVTRQIADFVANPALERLPNEVVHEVRRAILDSLGVSVAGTRHPASQKVIELVSRMSNGGQCHLIGSRNTVDPINAALANGVTAHVLDWDDTILPSRAHLGAVLLPPLIAAGEIEGWTIGQIIPAYAIGFEVGARLNNCTYPSIAQRGYQGTGIIGGIATAAAVGRMMKLDASRLCHAMGIAAGNTSGLIATFGSMTKALNLGRAGSSGLQSAYLAAQGFTSNEDIFGAGKFLELFDGEPKLDVLLDGFGERWSILENGYKPYPCGFVAHAMIDAVRDLRSKVGPTSELKTLRLEVSRESMRLMGNPDPANELEAKFSLIYEAAVAWVEGHVTPAAFDEEAIRDPRYRRVMARITIVPSDGRAQHEALAEAEFEDGSKESLFVPQARGTQARPLNDSDLREKFDAALQLAGMKDTENLANLVMSGDREPVRTLLKNLSQI